MDVYSVRYIHKISPSERDTHPNIDLRGGDFSDRKTLGRALRRAGVLSSGARITSFRVEGDRVVVFPAMPGLTTYWHSVILTHLGVV